jgi:cyclopropane fatty-acyl-phospholipid synthase-like methyltransferase
MGRQAFENYGRAATRDFEYIVLSGRYATLKTAEKRVVADVVSKLQLTGTDDLLEIGCGVGNLLIPLSFMTGSVTGIDHQGCLTRLQERFPKPDNVTLIPGNFLDLDIEPRFSKILVYSVIQLLSNGQEVRDFVLKAARRLRPGGRLLIGDIQNLQKYERVDSTDAGRAWRKTFTQQVDDYRSKHGAAGMSDCIDPKDYDKAYVRIDDALLLGLIGELRSLGFEAYLMPQPADLPFGLFSDDLLVTA